MKTLAAVFSLGLLLFWQTVAQAEDYTWTTNNDNTITITKYTGPGGDVSIPDTITGLPVTTIGNAAFYSYSSKATSVTIPNSVTTIGDAAFSTCSTLTNVTMGNSVSTIGRSAFYSCSSLTSITIPNSVITILDSAFNSCLELTTATLPNSVTTIGGSAFSYCSKLTTVNIPDNLPNISYWTFYYCSSLTNVTIPNSVTSIGDSSFYFCRRLTNIAVPNTVTNIGYQAFWGCTGLRGFTVDELNTAYSSPAGVLLNKDQTTLIQYPLGKPGDYKVPETVTRIEDYAFQMSTSLTNVSLPPSVTNIGLAAFASCKSLTNLTVDTLNPIFSSAAGVLFNKDLTTLIQFPGAKAGTYAIPDSVTSIGWGAFQSSTNLTNVLIANRVTSIATKAFQLCSNLRGVYFEGDAPALGSSVFTGANNVTVYYLPGTTIWGPTFGGRATALWYRATPTILSFGPSFGVQTNVFGFRVSWATNASVVIQAASSLVSPDWTPIATNTISTGVNPDSDGWTYLSNPGWSNHSAVFYRVRSQ